MTDINKAVSDYIKSVNKNLICKRKLKKSIINDFRNSVLDYQEEKNITDINDIYAHFGTAEEVAKNYLSDADPKEIKKSTSAKKIILIAILTACILYVAGVTIAYINSQQSEINRVAFESWSDPDIPEEILAHYYNSK